MAKHPWLSLRGRMFYARAPVPKDIVQSFGKKEVTYSLKTTDRRDADRLILIEAKVISDRFEEHRARLVPERAAVATHPAVSAPSSRLLGSQITRWCDEYFQQVVDEDFASRVDLLDKVRIDPAGFNEDKYIKHPCSDWYLSFYEELSMSERLLCCVDASHKIRLSTLRHALAVGDCAAHEGIARKFATSNNLEITPADLLRLTRKLIESEIAAVESIIQKDTIRYDQILSRHGTVDVATSPNLKASQATDQGALLTTLVPSFLDEGKLAGLAKKTTLSDATDLKEFVSVVGDKPIRAYTTADGTRYKDTLLSLPAQRQVAPFHGLTLADAAETATKLDPTKSTIRRLHVDTINDKLMVVRKFFRWADSREKGVTNPVDGLRIKPARNRGTRTKKRYPFTNEEMQKLFNGPIFTGCHSLKKWKATGNFVPRYSAQFWVPLIALFTGMRMGEIIQLRVSDVKISNGITFFNVTTALDADDNDGAKSTKNDNSVREVPLHAMLVEFGFQNFLTERQKSGSARLFTAFNCSPSDNSWSKTFSAWFTSYRRHVGVERIIEGKNRVDFHSFRHVFEDAVRDIPDVKKEWRDALQGHGEGGSSEDYGLGVRLVRLHEAIQKLQFPGLDLTHLLTKPPSQLMADNSNRSLP